MFLVNKYLKKEVDTVQKYVRKLFNKLNNQLILMTSKMIILMSFLV